MQIHLFFLFLTLFLLSLRSQFSRLSLFYFLHFSRWYVSIIDVSLSGFFLIFSILFTFLSSSSSHSPHNFPFFLFRFPFFSSLPFLLPLLTRPRATISKKSAILFPPFYLFLCSLLLFLHLAFHSSFFTSLILPFFAFVHPSFHFFLFSRFHPHQSGELTTTPAPVIISDVRIKITQRNSHIL